MNYRHTQIGKIIPGAMAIIIILMLLYLEGVRATSSLEIPFLFIVLITLSFFVSLTTEIGGAKLRCYFGFGLIRRTIALSDICEVRSVRNPWFSGWGIRWRPGGYWLWNVSGYQAVELVFNNGRRFRIGTDEPDALVRAIEINKNPDHLY